MAETACTSICDCRNQCCDLVHIIMKLQQFWQYARICAACLFCITQGVPSLKTSTHTITDTTVPSINAWSRRLRLDLQFCQLVNHALALCNILHRLHGLHSIPHSQLTLIFSAQHPARVSSSCPGQCTFTDRTSICIPASHTACDMQSSLHTTAVLNTWEALPQAEICVITDLKGKQSLICKMLGLLL